VRRSIALLLCLIDLKAEQKERYDRVITHASCPMRARSAITSHLRVAGTLTPEMIVSLILGVPAWGGLWFRDPQIRALIPRRSG